jgi:hypothetical protein
MAAAIRSLTLPPGFSHSSFAKTRAAPGAGREISTSGVFPIDETRERDLAEAGGAVDTDIRVNDSKSGVSEASPKEKPRRVPGLFRWKAMKLFQ